MQIVVDDILTNYEEMGEGKETLVILPGWMRTSSEWLNTARVFSDKYKVIILDLPGAGKTAKPQSSLDIFDYSEFVKHFLEKIKIKKCTVLGHSFGGRIGIILAANTNLLERLILVDAAGNEKKSLWIKTLNVLAGILSPMLPQFIKKILSGMVGSQDYKAAGEMKEIFIKIINQDLTPLLSKIKIPTTIVWGEKDNVLPISKAKIIKNEIDKSVLRIIWGTGHDPHLDDYDQFISVLKENL